MIDRDQIINLLKQNVCSVTFTKTDGSSRTLQRCTLIEAMLPEKKEGAKPRKQNDNVVPVFDLDEQAWKSFRLQSLKSLNTEPPEQSEGADPINVEGVVNKGT